MEFVHTCLYQELIEKIEAKEAQVAIIGLGYVGLTLAVEFASAGLKTIGIDLNAEKVALVSQGTSYLSELDLHKIRKLTIVGSRKMVVFDDVASFKIRTYDKSAERRDFVSYGDAISLRFGDVVIPYLEMAEPLVLECRHFVGSVQEGREPRSGGRDGLRVVQVLEAAQSSLEQDGSPVAI